MKKFPIFGLLGLGIVGYLAYRPKSPNLTDKINTLMGPKPSVKTNKADESATKALVAQAQKTNPDSVPGKLSITVTLKVSGTEKFAIGLGAYGGEQGLKDKVSKFAQDIIPTLNKGPIPKIVSKAYPKSFKSVDAGYTAVIAYMAMFHKGAKNEPVKKVALDYITKTLKANKEFGSRVLSVKAEKVA